MLHLPLPAVTHPLGFVTVAPMLWCKSVCGLDTAVLVVATCVLLG